MNFLKKNKFVLSGSLRLLMALFFLIHCNIIFAETVKKTNQQTFAKDNSKFSKSKSITSSENKKNLNTKTTNKLANNTNLKSNNNQNNQNNQNTKNKKTNNQNTKNKKTNNQKTDNSKIKTNPLINKEVAKKQEDLSQIRNKIGELKQTVAKQEIVRDDVADKLQATEVKISTLQRNLHELSNSHQNLNQRIEELNQQNQQLSIQLERAQKQLAAILRIQNNKWSIDTLRILVSGNDPNQMSRDAYYLQRLSAQRNNLISSIRKISAEKKLLLQEETLKLEQIKELATQQEKLQANLVEEKNIKQKTLDNLAVKIKQQRLEIGELQQNEQHLGNVIERLNQAILEKLAREQQRKQEQDAKREAARQRTEQLRRAAAEAEKTRLETIRRQQQLIEQQQKIALEARIQAEKEIRNRQQAEEALRKQTDLAKREIAKRQAAELRAAEAEAKKRANVEKEQLAKLESESKKQEKNATTEANIANEKVKKAESENIPIQEVETPIATRGLRFPAKGSITGRYGQNREGGKWKGIFIEANEGSPVIAAASGNVVFSEWMRGFGNLLIIDHRGGYLTVYANNDTVIKQVGDNVKAGDIVARVGNSGGNPNFGLYFEVRYRGKTLDPMSWLASR